jgi:hypothetical protein
MEIEKLYKELVSKLIKLFGKYDPEQHRFDQSSNTNIARELGYSDAQFSRLINSTATEGEYERAIQNVDRILKLNSLQSKIDQIEAEGNGSRGLRSWFVVVGIILITAILSFWMYSILFSDEPVRLESKTVRDDMLRWTFETSFVNPYVKLDQLPEDCNYPCYKYQGKWELDKTYKIPFFRERSGFHYLAKEVRMYARCMSEKSEKGEVIEGYEYQKHEIWYDIRELPIDSFLVRNKLTVNEAYKNLNLNTDPNFVKVADVHTFFRNEFIIDSIMIHRKGKVIGRDIVFVENKILYQKIDDEASVRRIVGEVNKIATNKLEDFSKPISCSSAKSPNLNFNKINVGDLISFDCVMTTSRTPVNYTKTYVLRDQYIENECREEL